MNKALLIKRLGRSFPELSEAQLHHMTRHLITMLGASMQQGERIDIRGFGSFTTKVYPARLVHNPRTGSYLTAAESVRPTIKLSTVLSARLNENAKPE